MTVAELLEKPENWCRKYYAEDANGIRTKPENQSAVRWCVIGAIRKCYFGQTQQIEAETKLTKVTGTWNLSLWNDCLSTTHQKMLEAVKEAGI